MSPKTALEPLLKTALLGTGRDTSSPSLDGPFQPFGDTKRGTENALLSAAAAITLCERAGTLPIQSDLPSIEICPPESRPYFSANATTLLAACISSQRELVPQALAWASNSGRIAPPSLLPQLLNFGRDSKELRRVMAPILGERGRWLAQLNPDWRNVAAPVGDLETSWQEGETVARREALHLKRENDPAGAREWVEAAFKTDGAKERNQWLELLRTSLSMDDEPFLESVLDDKSKEVRATAVYLLRDLPESRLVGRAKAELENVLKWTETGKKLLGLIGKKTGELTVELPAEWRGEWARDGLEENPSHYNRDKNLGQRATWVSEWLKRVPPSHWEHLWGVSPEQILQGTPQEWQEMLYGAWWSAAKKYREAAWLKALLAATDKEAIRQRFNFQNLPIEIADEMALSARERDATKISQNELWVTLLQNHPGPFSPELAQSFLELVQNVITTWKESGPQNYSQQYSWLRYSLPMLADKFPLEMAEQATKGWPEQDEKWPQWEHNVQQFIARLQLRAALYTEFQNQKI